MPEGRYAQADIEVLESVDAIRRRVHMYVGDPSDSQALNALVLETLCFAVDPKTGGPVRAVEFELLPDHVVEVRNDGPGLPLGRHASSGVSFVELIMTRLHACRDEKAAVANQKWCNAGIAVTNALSEWCVVTVCRDGGRWEQRFERGRASGDFSRIGDHAETGTTLRFRIDRSLMTAAFDVGALRERLDVFAAEVPCVSVSLLDRRAS